MVDNPISITKLQRSLTSANQIKAGLGTSTLKIPNYKCKLSNAVYCKKKNKSKVSTYLKIRGIPLKKQSSVTYLDPNSSRRVNNCVRNPYFTFNCISLSLPPTRLNAPLFWCQKSITYGNDLHFVVANE